MGITALIKNLIHLSRLTGETETSLRFTQELALADGPDASKATLLAIRAWAFEHLDAVNHHGLVAGLPVVTAAHALIESADAVLELVPDTESVLGDLNETVEIAAGGFDTDWSAAFAAAASTGRAAVVAVKEQFVAELDRAAFTAVSNGDEVWFELLCEVGVEAVELLGELAEVC